MSKACKPFNYSVDEGTKAFCIAELFIATYTFIKSCEIAHDVTRPYFTHYLSKMKFAYLYELTFLCVLSPSLFLQSGIGFLLYPFGWRKRNITIIYAWMICGVINLVFLCQLWIIPHVATGPPNGWKGRASTTPELPEGCSMEVGVASLSLKKYIEECEDVVNSRHVPFFSLLYMAYVPYGIFILWEFKKWARSTGVAVEITIQDLKTVKTRVGTYVHEHLDQHPVKDVHDQHKQKDQKDEHHKHGHLANHKTPSQSPPSPRQSPPLEIQPEDEMKIIVKPDDQRESLSRPASV